MEEFISGYCRTLDSSRVVTVENDNGPWEIDCDYGCCPHAPACPIAEKIRNRLNEE